MDFSASFTKDSLSQKFRSSQHQEYDSDEYVKSLEENFEYWDRVDKDNRKLTVENKKLRDIIDFLLAEISKKKAKNKKNREKAFIVFVRNFLIPRVRPDIVKEITGLHSSKLVVKLSEQFGLFRYPELVIRVPRTTKRKAKYETTVLYSLVGIDVLMKLVEAKIDERSKLVEEVSDEEMKEIMNSLTNEQKKRLGKPLRKPPKI